MKKTKQMANQAMIAAIYTVISVCLSAITYGPVQVRISEAMTLLPVFGIHNVWGVTIGCFMTNLIGFFTGANILGGLDMIFGTFATLAAALMSYALRNVRFRKMPVLSAIPPIIVNAVVIGWELCGVCCTGGVGGNRPVFQLYGYRSCYGKSNRKQQGTAPKTFPVKAVNITEKC